MLKSDSMEFQKPSRDVNLISGEWRLASVDEVKSNLEEIKSKGVLGKWSIVRVLDGWAMGSGYDYELHQGYKSGMSEMLLVKTNQSRPSNGLFDPEMHSGVELSAEGREAAVLLSVDDKITEVVHFVLHRFAKLEKLILKIKEDLGCDS